MQFMDKDIENTEQEKKYLLGIFIRYHRTKQNITLNCLANDIGITKSYLSDVEHGKKYPAQYTLHKILSSLDIEFNEDIKLKVNLQEKLKKLFEYYSFLNDESYLKLLEDIKSKHYEYSFAFLTFYIITIFDNLCRLRHFDNVKNQLSYLDKYKSFLDDYELVSYYFLKGRYYHAIKDFDNAKKYYLLVLKQNFNDYNILGITYCLLSTVEQYINNPIDAFYYNQQASICFKENYNILRLLETDVYKANIYSRIHYYRQAIKIYHRVIEHTQVDQLHDIKELAYDNLAWMYIKERNYLQAIQYAKDSLNFETTSHYEELYIYIPYAYYKLDQCNESLLHIKKYLPFLEQSHHKYFLIALQSRINDEVTKYIDYLNMYIDSLKKYSNDYEMLIFVYRELADYYKDIEDYKYLSFVQNEIISLMSR